jgi:hypothetical protein
LPLCESSSPTLSYKEILLLRPPSPAANDSKLLTANTLSSSWTPKIIVDKKLGKLAPPLADLDSKNGHSSLHFSSDVLSPLLLSTGPLLSEDEYDGFEGLQGFKSPAIAARSHGIQARLSMKRSGMSIDKLRELRSKF